MTRYSGVVTTDGGMRVQYTPEQEAAADAQAAADLKEAEAYALVKYRDDRKKAYGDIGDQLDMQYKDLLNGTTIWKDHVAKVKSDFPKG